MSRKNEYKTSPLNPELRKKIRTTITEWYGDRLSKLLLFGSYARGNPHLESDIDIFIILKDKAISIFNELDILTELTMPLNIRYGCLISPHPVSEVNFEQYPDYPLYRNVKEEGIVL
ncbi:MAG: nucleotidyltransferase domain-containing protein [Bacteroidia bacterium]|nr:nucleotidyltransferase domain-containing protein [Bacteroidia bacterium]